MSSVRKGHGDDRDVTESLPLGLLGTGDAGSVRKTVVGHRAGVQVREVPAESPKTLKAPRMSTVPPLETSGVPSPAVPGPPLVDSSGWTYNVIIKCVKIVIRRPFSND